LWIHLGGFLFPHRRMELASRRSGIVDSSSKELLDQGLGLG
jgi:hypothetical protein